MAPKLPPHDVADLGLAEAGAARVAWAGAQLPVLARIAERFAFDRPLDGVSIGIRCVAAKVSAATDSAARRS